MTSDTHFTIDWFSANVPVWEKHLAHLKDRPNVSVLEIGSWEGRSACWLLQHVLTHASSSITCIDLFDADTQEYATVNARHAGAINTSTDIDSAFDRNIRTIGRTAQVHKLKGYSSALLPTLPQASFDVIYIDGSHTAQNVLTDTMLSWLLLKDQGILILDDYGWPCFPERPLLTPRPAIDAFLKIFRGQYDILHKGYQVIIRKKLNGASYSPGLLGRMANRCISALRVAKQWILESSRPARKT